MTQKTVLGVALIVLGMLLSGPAAMAVMTAVPETGNTGQLVLWANPYPANFTLSATAPTNWRVSAEVTGDLDASLSMEIRRTGALAEHVNGMYVRVQSCSVPWDTTQHTPGGTNFCPGRQQEIVTVAPGEGDTAANNSIYQLGSVKAGMFQHYLVTLWLGADPTNDPQSTANLEAMVGIGITAVATEETVGGVTSPPESPSASEPPSDGVGGHHVTPKPLPISGGGSHSLAATGSSISDHVVFAVGCFSLMTGIAVVVLNHRRSAFRQKALNPVRDRGFVATASSPSNASEWQ